MRRMALLRPEQMLLLRLDGATYQAIGDVAGISRQRVQQILRPPMALRRTIVAQYNGRCEDCGVRVGLAGHLHHKDLAVELGQWNDVDNLELLCISCHRMRHGALRSHSLIDRRNRYRLRHALAGRCYDCGQPGVHGRAWPLCDACYDRRIASQRRRRVKAVMA